MTAQEVQDTVQEMGESFRGNSYHLLQKYACLLSNMRMYDTRMQQSKMLTYLWCLSVAKCRHAYHVRLQ